jgi:hypothetical protein
MMAWLHAVPKPPAGSKRATHGDQAARISRLDRLKKDKVTAQMPPNPMPHIIGRLTEIGITEAAGMGAAPISWATLTEWQRNTGVELMPWEARLHRKLSLAYLTESRRAEDENCPPPWRAEVTKQEIDAAERALRMVLG